MAEQPAKRTEGRAPARREDVRDPFMALRDRMERLIDDFSGGLDAWPFPGRMTPFEWRMSAFIPSIDIRDENNQIKIEAELPGVSEKDVEVSLSRDAVIIRGEKKYEAEEKERGYYRVERSYGSFERAISLPVDVDRDKVQAKFKNGVLSITLPKSPEAMQQTKKIPIQTEEKRAGQQKA